MANQPITPEMLPPELMAQNGMTPTEMKTDIKNKLGQTDNFNREVNAQMVIKKNDLEKGKAVLIQSLMGFLQEMGVDPSNPESIKEFLIKLEQSDPDLAAIFAFAFDRLAPAGEGQLPETSLPTPEGMPNIGMPPMEGMPSMPPMGEVPAMSPTGGIPPVPGSPPGLPM